MGQPWRANRYMRFFSFCLYKIKKQCLMIPGDLQIQTADIVEFPLRFLTSSSLPSSNLARPPVRPLVLAD